VLIIMARSGGVLDLSFLVDAGQWIAAWGEPPLLHYPDTGRLNAYVLWSLYYEWLFYIFILPLCALAMDRVRGRLPSYIVPVALLIVSLGARNLPLDRIHSVTLQTLPTFMPLFAIGMLAFEVRKSSALNRLLQRPAASAVAIAALIAGMVSAPFPYAVPQLFLFTVFFFAVANGNDLFGLLRTKGALALGECSFSIYLLHGIALDLLFVDGAPFLSRFSTNALVFFLPFVALVVACVTPLTYALIERPMISVGRRLARPLTGRGMRDGRASV
jgi:peptidoglycan/LPS O-acetylase OafA/YrhL